MPVAISLYTGAGGLDLGLEAAGFSVRLCVEDDRACQATLKVNRPKWKLAEPADVFKLDPKEMMQQAGIRRRELDLLAGGPPCQPFSKASYWRRGDSLRLRDPRAKTLNAYTKIVETLLPKVILLENVEGIKFYNKDEGLELLRRHLRAINKRHRTRYTPMIFTINAADFGAPQIRKRVFVVAARDGATFIPPSPTHGEDREPYLTAWDAIGDLENIGIDESVRPKGRWADLLSSIPEGENYLWHTDRGGGQPIFGFRTRFWSFLLKLSPKKPSWTIPAQPGPSTGPFHWNSRLLSVRELARLQTFPEDYVFAGSRQLAQKQIGNAVPPLIAEIIGREISVQLLQKHRRRSKLRHTLQRRKVIPDAPFICAVPQKYVGFVGTHAPHPGIGKGPGAMLRAEGANHKEPTWPQNSSLRPI
jgi:DNA (cytosine-5)-methyltransferase 1